MNLKLVGKTAESEVEVFENEKLLLESDLKKLNEKCMQFETMVAEKKQGNKQL